MDKLEKVNFSYLLEKIKTKKIKIDMLLLRKAYGLLEKNKTEDEINKYISRALILIEYNSDQSLIIASLIDFSIYNEDFIAANFPDNFLNIKKGFDCVDIILKKSENVDKQNFESLRKYLISSCIDVRVMIIKIARRLYVLRSKKNYNKEYIYKYAQRTMDIYSPICEYLGLNSMKGEIDDLSFKILYPDEFLSLNNTLFKDNKEVEIYSEKLEDYIYRELSKFKIKSKVYSRAKSISSIYKKIMKQKGYFDPEYALLLNDRLAFTILVNNVELCYKTLGIIHSLFPYISKKFDDYIARPKENGFRSLQTTVNALEDRMVEIQIKTYEMNEYNEFGPASHILYKRGNTKNRVKDINWVKDVSFYKGKTFNTETLFSDKIFVFTPQFMIKELRVGSNPIDFAYSVHTHIGNSMKGVKVNGKLVSLDAPLYSGDVVEVITDKNNVLPKKDWITIAKQISTKRTIRKFLKDNNESNEENTILSDQNKLNNEKKKSILRLDKNETFDNILNFDNIAVKLSKCCNPTVEDEVVGRVGTEGVIKIHKKNCSKLLVSKESTFNFSWNK